jgi:TolA-binding protein
MMQEARPAASSRKHMSLSAAKSGVHASAGVGPAYQQYQAALQLLQQGKFEKAQTAFEKLLPGAPAEIKERCKMYINTCLRQVEQCRLIFLTPEEHYDYAISQLNTGYFEEAREQFTCILEAYPRSDYAYYGLALLDAITGRTQDCLNNLAKAIQLNPKNRLQARADNDFQNMVDDPRFTELLYPEVS